MKHRIAIAQMGMKGEVEENLRNALAFMEEAADRGAQLIGFPEIQLTPFFPQYREKAPLEFLMDPNGRELQAICNKCQELGVLCVPNLYLRMNEQNLDASPMIERDGSVKGISGMLHISDIPYFREQDHYEYFQEGFKTYDTGLGRIGIVICYDRHFPESFRSCALQGADLVVVPTAMLKDEPMELFVWEMRIAAFQNGLFIALCNRTGREDAMDFCGNSLIVGPDGELIKEAGTGKECLIADIDLEAAERSRGKTEFLKGLRKDL